MKKALIFILLSLPAIANADTSTHWFGPALLVCEEPEYENCNDRAKKKLDRCLPESYYDAIEDAEREYEEAVADCATVDERAKAHGIDLSDIGSLVETCKNAAYEDLGKALTDALTDEVKECYDDFYDYIGHCIATYCEFTYPNSTAEQVSQ